MNKQMKLGSEPDRESKRKKARLAVAGLALLSVAASVLLSRSNQYSTLERLSRNVPGGTLIAAHDGALYLWKLDERTGYRIPVRSGVPTPCFRLTPDVDTDLNPTFRPIGDTLQIISGCDVAANGGRIAGRGRDSETPLRDRNAPKERGDFLQGQSRPGEHRSVVRESVQSRHQLNVWNFPWGANRAQSVPLPPAVRAASTYFVGANAAGLYVTTPTAHTYTEIIDSQGKWKEYPPDTSIIRIAPDGTSAETVATKLAHPTVTVAATAVCWETPRMYPDTHRDTVCRKGTATPTTILNQERPTAAPLQALSEGNWWIEPEPSDNVLKETLTGQGRSHVIEPPLRRSEADVVNVLKLYVFQKRLYLLCHARLADTDEREAPTSTDPHYTPETSPLHEHYYLMRLYPEKAGQAGFWGKPVALPEATRSCLFDEDALYVTCQETDQDFVFAMKDLLSSAVPQRQIRTALYRLRLP